MRDIGIVTLLGVVITAAAPAQRAPEAPSSLITAKSTQQFADCFVRTQDRARAAWAFVPKKNGGTFSNLGAEGVRNPYFVVISDRGEHREIRIEEASPESPAARGVNQCA